LIGALLCLLSLQIDAKPAIDAPSVVLRNVAADIRVTGVSPAQTVTLKADGIRLTETADANGVASFSELQFVSTGNIELSASVVSSLGLPTTQTLRVLPGWISVIPPLLAILIALLMRNVIPALIIGIWFGATALRSFSVEGIFRGLLDGFELYVVRALGDTEHAAIILFSMMIGGMVGIITRNGGMARIVSMIVSRAKSAVSGQVAVWGMGLAVFFDDYSNTLVVGNTARPLTDRLRISREKLAYIVDSTAAPVVCLALITTWIGYEVGLIDAALEKIPAIDEAPYTVFLHSIPYSFYPIFAVFFVLFVAATGRDIGPMYKAECRARGGQVAPAVAQDLPTLQGDNLDQKEGVPLRAINAVLPIVVLIVSLLAGLYYTGSRASPGGTLSDIIGAADAYQAMLWASLLGAATAAVMTVAQGILSTHETVDAWFGGVRAMLFAMIVLVLAWSLSAITADLHTADYLVSILANSLPPEWVPATVFLLAAITAFTTGTSWGTLGILVPLVVPLTWAVLLQNGMADAEHMHILYSAVACNLAGAVWGDHCSPISDTTVLSSMASGCDHIEHVRTQMPYAMIVGTAAIAVGTIPASYGLSPWISIAIGLPLLFLVLQTFGKRADDVSDNIDGVLVD